MPLTAAALVPDASGADKPDQQAGKGDPRRLCAASCRAQRDDHYGALVCLPAKNQPRHLSL